MIGIFSVFTVFPYFIPKSSKFFNIFFLLPYTTCHRNVFQLPTERKMFFRETLLQNPVGLNHLCGLVNNFFCFHDKNPTFNICSCLNERLIIFIWIQTPTRSHSHFTLPHYGQSNYIPSSLAMPQNVDFGMNSNGKKIVLFLKWSQLISNACVFIFNLINLPC